MYPSNAGTESYYSYNKKVHKCTVHDGFDYITKQLNFPAAALKAANKSGKDFLPALLSANMQMQAGCKVIVLICLKMLDTDRPLKCMYLYAFL